MGNKLAVASCKANALVVVDSWVERQWATERAREGPIGGPDKGNKAKRSRVVWVGALIKRSEIGIIVVNGMTHVYVSRVVLSRQWQARVRATPENVAPQPPNHRRLRCTVCKHLHVNFAVLHCSLLNTSLLPCAVYYLLLLLLLFCLLPSSIN